MDGGFTIHVHTFRLVVVSSSVRLGGGYGARDNRVQGKVTMRILAGGSTVRRTSGLDDRRADRQARYLYLGG